MNIKIIVQEGKIVGESALKLNLLIKEIFPNLKNDENLIENINKYTDNDLLSIFAMDDTELVGYKIGYAKEPTIFFSWIGAVSPKYRRNGIASKLIESQHEILKKRGYLYITTQSNNKYKDMMRLNLKFGFDIKGVNVNGDHSQIQFLKSLK
jgi:GNAT superfamily N-acetyltransferase